MTNKFDTQGNDYSNNNIITHLSPPLKPRNTSGHGEFRAGSQGSLSSTRLGESGEEIISPRPKDSLGEERNKGVIELYKLNLAP